MDADAAIASDLYHLRLHRPHLSGSVVAHLDGLLVAADLPGTDPHHVAAIAAAGFGLGHRFAGTLGHGPARELLVRAAAGAVLTFPAGRHGLLAVVAGSEADLIALRPELVEVAARVGGRLDAAWREPARGAAHLVDPHAPLATRTPMATLPAQLRAPGTRDWLP